MLQKHRGPESGFPEPSKGMGGRQRESHQFSQSPFIAEVCHVLAIRRNIYILIDRIPIYQSSTYKIFFTPNHFLPAGCFLCQLEHYLESTGKMPLPDWPVGKPVGALSPGHCGRCHPRVGGPGECKNTNQASRGGQAVTSSTPPGCAAAPPSRFLPCLSSALMSLDEGLQAAR